MDDDDENLPIIHISYITHTANTSQYGPSRFLPSVWGQVSEEILRSIPTFCGKLPGSGDAVVLVDHLTEICDDWLEKGNACDACLALRFIADLPYDDYHIVTNRMNQWLKEAGR